MKNIVLVVAICQVYFLRAVESCPTGCHCETKAGESSLPSSAVFLNCSETGLKDLASLTYDSPVISLIASHGALTAVTNESLSDVHLANVQEIELVNNRISHIDVGAFRRLKQLRSIDLGGNDLSEIQSDLFAANKVLSFLTLKGNPRLVLPEGSWNVPNLVWLDLSECGLKTLPHQFFKLMTRIESIYLSKNQLSYVEPPTILSIAPTLTTLDLHGNKFSRIQDELLQDLPPSCEVPMHDNPFHCDCHFQRGYSRLQLRSPVVIQPKCATPENLLGTKGNNVQAALRCNGTKTSE